MPCLPVPAAQSGTGAGLGTAPTPAAPGTTCQASPLASLGVMAHKTAEAPAMPLEFCIFGHPCALSPSPEIHNIGFACNGLSHRYGIHDHPGISSVLSKLREAQCKRLSWRCLAHPPHDEARCGFMSSSGGGGSVTIPHKEAVVGHMASLSPAAKAIGAVNTVTKALDGSLHGENTDWLGIKNQLEARRRRTHNFTAERPSYR
jgi:shikimate 5-dehydrogenase